MSEGDRTGNQPVREAFAQFISNTEKDTMTSTSATSIRASFSAKLLVGGILAGIVMAMWEMIVEAVIPGGKGFWSPVVYIGATVARDLQSVTAPVQFTLIGVFLGLMGHMMNSIVFGLIFALLIAPRTKSLFGKAIAGLIYGAAIYLVMWYLIVPALDPVMLNLNATFFLIGHMMYGIVLGAVNHWATTKG